MLQDESYFFFSFHCSFSFDDIMHLIALIHIDAMIKKKFQNVYTIKKSRPIQG